MPLLAPNGCDHVIRPGMRTESVWQKMMTFMIQREYMRAFARTCDSFCSDNGGLDKVGIETVHEDSQAGGDLVRVDDLR